LQKAAEAFLPVLESKEGILLSMDDIDGLHVWSFKYRSAMCIHCWLILITTK